MITSAPTSTPDSAQRRASASPPAASAASGVSTAVDPSAVKTFAKSVSHPCAGCRRRRGLRVARRRPGVAADRHRVADEDEQRHGERRHQGRELEPESTRSDPRPQEPQLRAAAAADQPGSRRSARRPRARFRGSRRYREIDDRRDDHGDRRSRRRAPPGRRSRVARSRLARARSRAGRRPPPRARSRAR